MFNQLEKIQKAKQIQLSNNLKNHNWNQYRQLRKYLLQKNKQKLKFYLVVLGKSKTPII